VGAVLCLGSYAGVEAAPPEPDIGADAPLVDIGDSAFRSLPTPSAPAASLVDLNDGAFRAPPIPPSAAESAAPVDVDDGGFRGSPDNTPYTRDLRRVSTDSGGQATVTLVESLRGAKAGTRVTASVTCPAGQELRGGGASVQTSDGEYPARAVLSQSYASSTRT
jgi:hypothetical protein